MPARKGVKSLENSTLKCIGDLFKSTCRKLALALMVEKAIETFIRKQQQKKNYFLYLKWRKRSLLYPLIIDIVDISFDCSSARKFMALVY